MLNGGPLEVGHFRPSSLKAQALEMSMSPVAIVGERLAYEETFQRHAAEVAGAADPTARADELAAGYVRSGAGRPAIALMLVKASNETSPWIMARRLGNMSRVRAVRSNAPLDAADPKYWSTLAILRYERGAEILARRGARRCLRCGDPNVSGYCRRHPAQSFERTADRDALRVTCRAIAEELGLSTDGPKARRVRRARR